MIFINLNDIAISNIYGADYRCLITGISKSGAIDLFKNVDLSEKKVEDCKTSIFLQYS